MAQAGGEGLGGVVVGVQDNARVGWFFSGLVSSFLLFEALVFAIPLSRLSVSQALY